MKQGICPKCESGNVYYKPGELREVRLRARPVECVNYVCVDCGYFESYISDTDALNVIPLRAEKVGDWKKAG